MKMDRSDWKNKVKQLLRIKGKGPMRHQKTMTSAVTTAWGVFWDCDSIARDLLQNFFDANRSSLAEVKVKVKGPDVTISAPAAFNLERLFYLGSEKGEDNVGEYGEGFKAAVVNLLRDHGVEIVAVSDNRCVHIHLSDGTIEDTVLQPIVYDFYLLPVTYAGALLFLPGCSDEMVDSLSHGLDHFLHDGNPLLGEKLWSSPGNDFVIYGSTDGRGYTFYRNLRRGEITDIPVVLVINKKYARMEQLVGKDRDRKSYNEKIMETYFSIFVKYGIKSYLRGQRILVERAHKCWATGHPLLNELSKASWHHRDRMLRSKWSKEETTGVFGDRYFARSRSKDGFEQLEYTRLETTWSRDGRTELPGYFRYFGVLNAQFYLDELRHQFALDHQRTPTSAEESSITLLSTNLRELAPEIIDVFSQNRSKYTVVTSDEIYGALQRYRGYYSVEIFLERRFFVSDFDQALATFLHEHAHVFGHDGSHGFTDALTDLIATLVSHRHLLGNYARDWEAVRSEVIKERLASHQDGEKSMSVLSLLTSLSDPDMRTVFLEMCARFPVAELEALAKLALVKKMATVLKNAA